MRDLCDGYLQVESERGGGESVRRDSSDPYPSLCIISSMCAAAPFLPPSRSIDASESVKAPVTVGTLAVENLGICAGC